MWKAETAEFKREYICHKYEYSRDFRGYLSYTQSSATNNI